MSDAPQSIAKMPSAGRAMLLAGWGLVIVGIPLFVVQSALQRQFVPWYVPILATIGLCLIGVSLYYRRGFLRYVAVGLVGAYCAFAWFALGVMVRLPEYTGPAVAMEKLPEFSTRRADGRPFTSADLETGRATVLTFFRGRW